jgi:peroxiredoxin 2/4
MIGNDLSVRVNAFCPSFLRLVEALQTSDREAVSTPEGWRRGGAVIEPTPITVDALGDSGSSSDRPDWY